MGAPPKTAARQRMLELASTWPDATLGEMFAEAGISHTAHGNWMREDPAYSAAFEALREGRLDAIESNALAEIARRGSREMLTALPYGLLLMLGGYLAKARRRVERSEVRHSGEVRLTHAYAEMSEEELRAEADRRARDLKLGGLPRNG